MLGLNGLKRGLTPSVSYLGACAFRTQRMAATIPALMNERELAPNFAKLIKLNAKPWEHQDFNLFEVEITNRIEKFDNESLIEAARSLIKLQLLQRRSKVESQTGSKVLASKLGATILSRIETMQAEGLLVSAIHTGCILSNPNDKALGALRGLLKDNLSGLSLSELTLVPSALIATKSTDASIYKAALTEFTLRLNEDDNTVPLHLASFFRRSANLTLPAPAGTAAKDLPEGDALPPIRAGSIVGARILADYLALSPIGMVNVARFVRDISETATKAQKNDVSALAEAHMQQVTDRISFLLNHPSEDIKKRVTREQAIKIVTYTAQTAVSKEFAGANGRGEKYLASLAALTKRLGSNPNGDHAWTPLTPTLAVDLVTACYALSSRNVQPALVSEALTPLVAYLDDTRTGSLAQVIDEAAAKKIVAALTLSQKAPQKETAALAALLALRLKQPSENFSEPLVASRVLELLPRPFVAGGGLTTDKANLLATSLRAFSAALEATPSAAQMDVANGVSEFACSRALLAASLLMEELPHGSPVKSQVSGSLGTIAAFIEKAGLSSKVVFYLSPGQISQTMVDALPRSATALKKALLDRVK